MNLLPPVQSGLSGVSRGLENIQEIAGDIARTGTVDRDDTSSTLDLTQSVVDLKSEELATQAATKVVASADQILGTLLDVRA